MAKLSCFLCMLLTTETLFSQTDLAVNTMTVDCSKMDEEKLNVFQQWINCNNPAKNVIKFLVDDANNGGIYDDSINIKLAIGNNIATTTNHPAAGWPVPVTKLIRNHSVWRDTQGNRIDCHEGGLLRLGTKYFWYGRSYHGNDKGIYGGAGAKFRGGINCYSSDNLVDWTFEGPILSYPDSGWITTGTWHRPRVIFNEKTSKYVLWFFCLGTFDGKFWVKDIVGIADNPTGPFHILGERKLPIEPSGDLALLVDVDGSGYMANGDWQRNGFVLQLTDDFQNAIGEPVKALPAGPFAEYEGLSLIRFKDKYIFAGSGVAGLNPTETSYSVAEAPLGPYSVKGVMSKNKTWHSQLSSFAVISETNTLMALCEQWLTGPDGRPVTAEKSTQLWLPVSFDPKTGTAVMRYVREWDPGRPQE